MQWGEPWTREQAALADVVMLAWLQHERWPIFEYVASNLDDAGIDALRVLESFPILGTKSPTTRWYSDVRFDRTLPFPPDDSEVQLSVSGLARHEHGVEMAQAFVAVLSIAAERHRQASLDPTRVVDVTLSSDDLAQSKAHWWPNHTLRAAGTLLRTEMPAGLKSISGDPDSGRWQITVGRAIRRYARLTLDRYIALIQQDVAESAEAASAYNASLNDQWTQPTSLRSMKPEKAIEELRKLRAEADSPDVMMSGPAHDEWRAKVRVVMQRALGSTATVLKSFEDVRYWIGISSGAPDEAQRDRQYFAEQVSVAAAYIDAAIYELELDLDPEASTVEPAPADAEGVGTIFVVHGRDDGLKAQVQNLLERATGAEIVVLHQQADQGRTVIEKFEAHAQQSMFAVILLTPDDEGRLKGQDHWKDRARQNVVLEHGYFIGRLGRSRVVALYKGDVELPSDLNGIIYKRIDNGDTWKYDLAKELRAAKIDIDMNKVV